MAKSNILTKSITILGTILALLPLLVPLFFGVLRFIREHAIQIDLQLPVGVLVLWLLGDGLLIWAAYRARQHQDVIIGCVALSILSLILLWVIAVVLAISSIIALKILFAVVIVILLALFYLALLTLAIEGIKLIRDLMKPNIQLAENP